MIQLIKGECLEAMKGIPTGSIDAIITDPPYGTTKCKWDSVIPFEPMWEQLNRIIKSNGAIVLFSSQPFTSKLIVSNIKNFRYEWIYKKTMPSNFMNAKKMPMKWHENILVFYKKLPTYNPQMREAKERTDVMKKRDRSEGVYGKTGEKEGYVFRNNGLKHPKTIIEVSNADQTNKLHPTQKPILLMEYLIKTYTNENEIVLDFTMGSGTTGVAAKNLNRSFIGIELDDKYFEIAQERICDH
jgi:site-specific DNA-methyltransferase (adenine-specific)